jgi:integrase
MSTRGLGRVFQQPYRNPRTGEMRRTETWYVAYSYRGKAYLESSHSRNRSDAVRLLKQRLAEIGQGRLIGPNAERTTFDDLAQLLDDDYVVNRRKSLDTVRFAIKRLRPFFGRDRAHDITTDRVKAYVRARQEAGAALGTIRNDLAALKRMFRLGMEVGKVAQRPVFPTLEIRNTREGFFEEPEYRAVLRHLPEYLRAFITFLYLTGWRKGEAQRLQWRQVDLEARTIRLEPGTTKNDEGRLFPFSAFPTLEEVLRAQWQHTQALAHRTETIVPWVFHRQGKPIGDFRKAWETACRAAGVPGRIPHDFRRTAVRNLERAGVPRSVAMKLTGHKTESVYRRYAIVSEADLSVGVAKLAALHSAASDSRRVIPFAPAHEAGSR